MDWTAYTDTGIVDADPEHTYIDTGAIKPTFRIDTDSDTYIIQTAAPDATGRLHKQRELYERLEGTAIPVPDVVHDGTGEEVPYQVLEYIDGDDPHDAHREMGMGEVLELTDEAGRYLAQAHEDLPMDGYGWIRGSPDGLSIEESDNWRSFYRDFVEGHIDRIEDGPLDRGDLTERARDVVDATIEDVPKEPYGAVCHRDYRPGNLLADDIEITAVLDWDNAFAGDPRYDLARSQQSFGGTFADSAQEGLVRHRFRQAYEDVHEDLDDELHDIYSVGARLDHGSAATWLVENGYDMPAEYLEAQRNAISFAIDRLE